MLVMERAVGCPGAGETVLACARGAHCGPCAGVRTRLAVLYGAVWAGVRLGTEQRDIFSDYYRRGEPAVGSLTPRVGDGPLAPDPFSVFVYEGG